MGIFAPYFDDVGSGRMGERIVTLRDIHFTSSPDGAFQTPKSKRNQLVPSGPSQRKTKIKTTAKTQTIQLQTEHMEGDLCTYTALPCSDIRVLGFKVSSLSKAFSLPCAARPQLTYLCKRWRGQNLILHIV